MAALVCRFMRKLTSSTQNIRRLPCLVPARHYALMDDDGEVSHMKTSVTILNKEQDGSLFIDAYSEQGFKLNTGIRVMGPCAIFPRSVLHWNVKGVEDIHEDSLSLFTMLEPKIDILVIGVGERENISKVNPKIIQYLRSKKINIELLATDQALSTFNFLNSEKRYVAGAFLPPSYMELDTGDEFSHSSLSDVNDPYVLPGEILSTALPDTPGELDDLFDKKKREPPPNKQNAKSTRKEADSEKYTE